MSQKPTPATLPTLTPTPTPPLPPGYFPPQTPIGDDAKMRMLLPVGRSGLAIAAGYLGLLSLAIFPAPIALGISIWAMIDLRRHPEKHGWGRAILGVVLGGLGSIIFVFIMIGLLIGR